MAKLFEIDELVKGSSHRLIYPQMGGMGLALTDYSMFEIYESADKQLEIALLIEENFPTDFIYAVDFGTIFQFALGFEMLKPERDFPSVIEAKFKNLDDVLNAPHVDVFKDGLFPEYLESIRKIAERIDKPQMVSCVGPLTLASELSGLEVLLRSSINNLEFFRALLQYANRCVFDFCGAAIDNGASVLQISEPVMSLMRPKFYKEEVLQYLKKLIAEINSRASSALHVCGDTSKHLPIMVESGAQILSLDQIMDLGWVAQVIPGDVLIAGNIDPVKVMLSASPEEVFFKTSELLEEMQSYDNYLVSFGCDCPIETPIENMQAVIAAVNKY